MGEQVGGGGRVTSVDEWVDEQCLGGGLMTSVEMGTGELRGWVDG